MTDPSAPVPPCPLCASVPAAQIRCADARRYHDCAVCGVRFLDPSQRLAAAAEADYYRTHHNAVDDAGYRRFLSTLAAPLLQRLPPASDGLDFGCGPGPALAAILAEAGHRMSLYDPLFATDVDVLARDYDFITCSEVLEHLHAPAAVIARLLACLRPHGWLAAMTGFLPDDEAVFEAWHYRRDPTHVVFYRPRSFAWIAARHRLHCEIPCRNVVLLRRDDAS